MDFGFSTQQFVSGQDSPHPPSFIRLVELVLPALLPFLRLWFFDGYRIHFIE